MIQLLDEPVFLKQRDEHAGADKPQLRVLPSHQSLRAGQIGLFTGDIELRLKVYLELLFFDGQREILDQLFGIQFGLAQRVVIDADVAREAVAYGIRSDLGAVKTPLELQRFIHIGIDAHAQAHTVVGILLAGQAHRGVVKDSLIVLPMGAVHQKNIRLTAADDAARVMHHLPRLLADTAKHLVRIGAAITLIDGAETVDIQDNSVHRGVPVILVVLLGIAEEELAVIQAGQRIALGGLDNLPSLGQLNGAAHTREDNARLRIGLLDEVAGPGV